MREKHKLNNDILTGNIAKTILVFFFPILIGTFFQQLYNTVDAIIVGKYAGTIALSSVGGSSAIIINLVVGFFTGLSSGCTVTISQYYGADDKHRLDEALHTSYAFGITGGVFFGILGVVSAPAILRLMNTPAELLDSSRMYIQIYFGGLVFVFIYNMGASILRALGDSKRPLYYLVICTVINIVFDLVFVVFFEMGVFGVALATLIAQAASALLVTLCLMRHTAEVKLELHRIHINKSILDKMLAIGIPAGIQSSTYALSNMFIQSSINNFGVDTVAGWTAEGKVDTIFWMINGSFGVATTTFVGQNFGARNMERVKKGTTTCLLMSLSSAIVISTLLYNFGQYMLLLFTNDQNVITIGAHLIRLIVPGYCIFVFIEVFSASLRATGNTLIPTLINIICIVGFRMAWISYFGGKGNLDKIIFCYPASWFVCCVFMSGYFLYSQRKLNRMSSVDAWL